jgi:eukaryotic-like serine/threonine-protein kinase
LPDEAQLLDVASAVADGSDVDWNTLIEGTAGGRERTVIRELRLLAEIARAMGSATDAPDAKPATPEAAAGEDDPKEWGHLHILEKLGGGTYGVVYRAWETQLQCEVALKLGRPSTPSRPFDRSRALKEARMLARVRHRNVVKVYGADDRDGRFGLWMELVSGRTLAQALATHGPLGAHEAGHIGVELCHALAAVHGMGLLHRDIKASNVMRENGGRILLMDFGAGRPVPTSDAKVVDVAGTPLYLAPELFLGEKPSPASDIYSLGVLLYHLLTGDYPVSASSRQAIQLAHRRNESIPLRDARPDLPSAFVNVIERALAPVGERYQTAGTFGNALAAAVGGVDTRGNEPKPRPIFWKPVLAAAGIGVLALLVATQIWRNPQAPAPGGAAAPTAVAPAASRPEAVIAAAAAPAEYHVEAAFYVHRNDRRVLLTDGSPIAPAEALSLNLDVSQPSHVYVINQDDKGVSVVLFPLEGQLPANPIPAGPQQLPGLRNGVEQLWQVSSAGGREHFLVYVSPSRLVAFESLLAPLPRAAVGRPVQYRQVPSEAIGVLRSVGGLTAAPPAAKGVSPSRPTSAALIDLPMLPQGREAARDVWARRISFANPEK